MANEVPNSVGLLAIFMESPPQTLFKDVQDCAFLGSPRTRKDVRSSPVNRSARSAHLHMAFLGEVS